MNATPPHFVGRLGRARAAVLVALLAVAGAAAFFQLSRTPAEPPSVPWPPAFNQLDPQLQHYVSNHVQWVRQAPRDGRRHATLGLIYAVNSLWPEALAAFNNTVQLSPDQPLGHLYVAIATDQSGNSARALELYQEVTRAFPTLAPAWYRLGEASLRAARFDDAQIAFERLAALAPAEWRAPAGLGEIRLRRGEPAQAAALFERALSLSPESKVAHHLLGQAYQSSGRTNEAALHLRLGLNAIHYPMPDDWAKQAVVHTRNLADQFELARQYLADGTPDRAVSLLEAALPFHPEHPSLLENLAVALNQAGQPERARDLLLQLSNLQTNHLNARVALVESCLALNQLDEARHHAAAALRLAPDKPQAHLAQANVQLAAQLDAQALDSIHAAIRLDPLNAALQAEAGNVCLYNLHQPSRALAHYNEAIRLDPTLVLAHVRRIEALLKTGDRPAAAAAVETLRQLDPSTPDLAQIERGLSIQPAPAR